MRILRQTNLNLEELLEHLKNPSPRYPKCFIINEIGAICYDGEEKAKKAEEILRNLLASKNESDRLLFVAFL